MKRPKNRDYVFTVIRTRFAQTEDEEDSFYVVGVFRTEEEATNAADAAMQEMIDSGLGRLFRFDVQISTYYDT